jgi:phosphocarrier protein
MLTSTATIINKLGLHARAASVLSNTATRYSCGIKIGIEGKMVDAKSVMSLMLLAASQGSELQLVIDGNDENEALEAIHAIINNRFGEPE